jgi:S-formylglutathione hydrolase FrmB
MRRLTTSLVALLLLPVAMATANPARITGERSLGPNRVELTIATPALTGPTKVQVFLPAGYDQKPKRRWPVTYYLHGAQGDEARFFPWYGDLIKDDPSIFVAPAGGPVGFYSDWFNGGKGGPPMYETYDIDQLIPLIDSRFRTIAKRAGRALVGESMGGWGVMTYAARHPDLFTSAASLSGFNDSNVFFAAAVVSVLPFAFGGQIDAVFGPQLSQQIRWHGHNPVDLADNLRDVDLQVRTAPGIPWLPQEGIDPVGNNGVNCVIEQGIFQTTSSLNQRLTALGIPHLWKEYPSGCHTIANFRREFTDALPGIERALAHPRPAPKQFNFQAIEPRFSIWGWDVAADPRRALEFLQMRKAGRDGVTLIGSGATSVTTPPLFRGAKRVELGNASPSTAVPDKAGRIRFSVDLGPPDSKQQYTLGATTNRVTRSVTFRPVGLPA